MTNLFISLYNERNGARREELEKCLYNNVKCEHIDRIYVLLEKGGEYWRNIDMGGKAIILPYQQRPTYLDFFRAANKATGDNDINIIANSDIYFNHTIKDAEALTDKQCFALSRWDIEPNGDVKHYDLKDSQDVWIFKGPINIPEGVEVNFPMGKLGCDNRLAYELDQAGYDVQNPSRSIKGFHLHTSNVRRYNRNREGDVIRPPYKSVHVKQLPIKKLRCLHVSLDTNQPQHALNRALDRAFITRRYHWQEFFRNGNDITQQIINASAEHKADIIFMQIQRDGVIDPARIRQANGFIVNWTGDVRHPLPDWYVEVGQNIDLTLFTNINDVETARINGVTADYLQIGYDQLTYKPLGGLTELSSGKVVFLANHYGDTFPLSGFRKEVVLALKERYPDRFKLFGNGWEKTAIHSQGTFNLDPKSEALILRSADIVINLSHYNYKRYSSDRLWRALGCGAFVLSHHYDEIELEFTPGKHLVTWKDIDDLYTKIDHYLADEKSRKQIAANGCNLVTMRDTWDMRIRKLQKLIKQYNGPQGNI